jgi:hypothetical protein
MGTLPIDVDLNRLPTKKACLAPYRGRQACPFNIWQPGCLFKTRGFPSPPRDGFGFVKKNCVVLSS